MFQGAVDCDPMTDAPVAWETKRLMARRATRDAAPQIFEAYAQDLEVARYMIWRPHRDVDETVAFLDRCERAWQDRTAFPWTLWLKDDGRLAGMIETRCTGTAVDIGYVLRRSLWRRGLMTEAVRFVVEWALLLPGVYRVWATCDVENVASARLLESVGMEREGVLRRWIVHPNISAEPRDALCYAIVR
jgi:RimJ/RimL family protein N-acetyltransferase